jgi:hypothetical protein
MAKVRTLVITCDRHGGTIDENSEFLHLDVQLGKKVQGRKRREAVDLCVDCSKAFLEFMKGDD